MHSPLEEDGFEPSVPLTRYAGLFRERGSYDDFAPPGSLLTLCLAESGATALYEKLNRDLAAGYHGCSLTLR